MIVIVRSTTRFNRRSGSTTLHDDRGSERCSDGVPSAGEHLARSITGLEGVALPSSEFTKFGNARLFMQRKRSGMPRHEWDGHPNRDINVDRTMRNCYGSNRKEGSTLQRMHQICTSQIAFSVHIKICLLALHAGTSANWGKYKVDRRTRFVECFYAMHHENCCQANPANPSREVGSFLQATTDYQKSKATNAAATQKAGPGLLGNLGKLCRSM